MKHWSTVEERTQSVAQMLGTSSERLVSQLSQTYQARRQALHRWAEQDKQVLRSRLGAEHLEWALAD